MKNIFRALAALIIFTFIISACAPAAPAASGGDNAKKYTICFAFQDLETEFWMAGHKAITETLKAKGYNVVEVNSNEDANKQLEQVKNCIAQKVDGIMVIPVDGSIALKLIAEANKAGIPIGIFNRPPQSDEGNALTVVANNEKIAEQTVEYMAQEAKKLGRKVTPLIMVGDLGDPNAVGRKQGFYNVIEKYPDLFNKPVEVATKWNADVARDGLQAAMTANPDVDFLFTSSDFLYPTIQGVLEPLGKWTQIGDSNHVIMGGLDGDKTACSLMQPGNAFVDATGVQDLYFEADALLGAIVKAVESGENQPDAWIDDPGFALTQGNMSTKEMDMWGCKLYHEEVGGAPQPAPATGDLPTLDYHFVAGQYKDDEMAAVEEAANAILAKEIGAKIKFHPMTFTDAPTKATLLLNSGEKCDLISFGGFVPIAPAIASGGIIPLEDLLPKYAPTVWGNFSERAWESTRQADGHIYGGLNFDIGGVEGAAMWVRKDLVDKYNFDWENAKTPEAWEPFFDQVVANEEGVTPLISSDPFWGRTWWPKLYGYDPVDSNIGAKGNFGGSIAVKMDDPNRKVVAAAFTPEYKQAIEMNRKWYEKGYYLKTPPADAEMGNLRNDLKFAAFYVPFGGFWSTKAMSDNEWNGVPILVGFVQDPLVQSLYSSGSSYGVCATSENPVEAVKFIEEVNTNPDLLNLLNYGIEGKDWVWADKENKVITFPEGIDATTVGWNPNTYWQFGDKRLMYLTTPEDIGMADRVAKAKESAIISNMAGFVLDPSPIESDIANVASAATQYCDPVEKGLVDVADGIKACQDGLKAAGIDKVLAEIQNQIDAWAKTQE